MYIEKKKVLKYFRLNIEIILSLKIAGISDYNWGNDPTELTSFLCKGKACWVVLPLLLPMWTRPGKLKEKFLLGRYDYCTCW